MKEDSPIHILWVPTIVAGAVVYIVSQIDLIPGISPIGWLDDIAVFIALIWFFKVWWPKNRHRIYWYKPRSRPEKQTREEPGAKAAHTAAREFDPFEVLNVGRDTPAEDIKHAYRELLSKYHPDKVCHLGEEFRRMAHDKIIDINKAYEMIRGKG